MAIGNLFGAGGESNSLYGTSLSTTPTSFIYFEWFIFKASTGQPATPTGGSWDFLTNTGTPPTGWVSSVNGVPLDNLWFSVAFVDSRNPTNIVWSTTGLISAATSIYASAYADKFTGNGSTTAWTLSADPVTINNLDVSVNGVTQTPTTDYTISGTTFTTTTAAPLGSILLVKYRQALPTSYYGMADNVGYLPAGTGAVLTNVQAKLRQYVSVFDFMTSGQILDVQSNTGSIDVSAAVQAAITAAAGIPVYFPAGTYQIGTTINCSPTIYDSSSFGAPAKIIGDGQLKTIFDNRVNGPLFSLVTTSTSSVFKGALGGRFEGFTIKRGASTTNGVGIYMTGAYQPTIQNVNIIGMSLHGIQIPNILGDNDASNMVLIDHVRIENCAGWGIKANGDSSFNETSYIYMQQVFIQNCGTTDGAYQPGSGGMNWKGQILTMQQCAFTINQNCALWIPGQSGAANTVDLQDTTFENNKVRGIFCRGVSAFKGRNVQIYNDQTYTATNGCEFEANDFTIENVELDGCYIRATSNNNAYTAFKISGTNANLNTCRVTDVTWNNFDYSGQTRFSGWQFDPIPNNGILVVGSSTEVYLKPNTYIGTGNKVPLRLQGPNNQSGTGVASTSGEWIANQLASGGLFLNPASFTAGTRYYVYLYDNDGAPALEASSSASFVTDSTSGYAVKSGDATRYYVGSVIGGSTNGTVATAASGWLNPQAISATQTGVPSYLWADSTNRLRIKTTLPTSDTDGTVVGTQT